MSTAARSWPNPPDPRRRKIEQALVAIVCERGLTKTTVELVCERSGVEEAEFRDYFTDVEEGFRHLFEVGSQEVLFGAIRAFSYEQTWVGRMRAVSHAMFRFIAEDERRARFVYVESFSAGEESSLVRDQGMEGMFELIDLGRQELDDPDSLTRATAEAIGGGILQRIRVGVEQDDIEGLRLSIPRLMYNVVLPYLGPESAQRELEAPPPRRPARQRIADGLLELCFERGYREVTLAELLERAEVDRSEFEGFYDDLEDCFCSIYEGLQGEMMARVTAAVEGAPSWRDGLRAVAYAIVGYLEEDECRAHLMAIEVMRAGERAGLLLAEAFEQIFDILDRGRWERAHAGAISRATAEAIGGTIFTQMYAAFEDGSVEAVRAKVPEMMYVAVLPYMGEQAAEEELHRDPA